MIGIFFRQMMVLKCLLNLNQKSDFKFTRTKFVVICYNYKIKLKVQTGQSVAQVPTDNPTFSVAWHPSKLLLAYTCDDKDKYHKDRDAGTVKLFGLLKE